MSGSRNNQVIIIIDNSGAGPTDGVQSRGNTGTYTGVPLDVYTVADIHVQFLETTGSLFSSKALPSTLNDTDFDLKTGFLRLSDSAGEIRFGVDSFTASVAPVPVPAAVWLMGSALAGLVGFKRKKAV